MTACDCRESGRPVPPCLPPQGPARPPRVLPGPLSPGLDRPVVERKKTSAAMEDQASGITKEGRKPQPHALQPSEVPVVFQRKTPWLPVGPGLGCAASRTESEKPSPHAMNTMFLGKRLRRWCTYCGQSVADITHQLPRHFPGAQAASPSSNPILASRGQQGWVLACKAAATHPAWPRPTPSPIHSTNRNSEKSRHVQGHTGQSWARIQVS